MGIIYRTKISMDFHDSPFQILYVIYYIYMTKMLVMASDKILSLFHSTKLIFVSCPITNDKMINWG